MTQENKQLLLVDLCARLDYGVKIYFGGIPKLLTSITIKPGHIEIIVEGEYGKAAYCDSISTFNNKEYYSEEITEKCKPYLRPMSSMTDEERKEYYTFQYKFTLQTYEYQELNKETFSEYLNWLNKKMFDYRGLIPKGLALEAPENMYNNE